MAWTDKVESTIPRWGVLITPEQDLFLPFQKDLDRNPRPEGVEEHLEDSGTVIIC